MPTRLPPQRARRCPPRQQLSTAPVARQALNYSQWAVVPLARGRWRDARRVGACSCSGVPGERMRRVRVPARCSRRLGGSVRGLAIDPVCRCGGAGVRGTRGLSLPLPKASGGSRATPGGRARGCANWDLTLGGAGGPARRGASAGTSVACAERWASRTGVSRWHWGRRGRGAHFGRIGRPRLVHARCCALPCIAMGPAPGGGCRPKQGAGSVRTAYRGCRGAGFEGPRVCRARRDVHRVTRGGSACRLRQTGQLVRN